MEIVKNWVKNTQVIAIHLIAYVVVGSVLAMYAAELYKWNSFAHQKIVAAEIYERMVTGLNEKLFQFVFTILAFFFGKDLGKKEEQQKNTNDATTTLS